MHANLKMIYAALIDRGWRRSGTYTYKPDNHKRCCPSYTIRLDTTKFVPSKSQLRVLNKVRKFLDGTPESKSTPGASADSAQPAAAPACVLNAIERAVAADATAAGACKIELDTRLHTKNQGRRRKGWSSDEGRPRLVEWTSGVSLKLAAQQGDMKQAPDIANRLAEHLIAHHGDNVTVGVHGPHLELSVTGADWVAMCPEDTQGRASAATRAAAKPTMHGQAGGGGGDGGAAEESLAESCLGPRRSWQGRAHTLTVDIVPAEFDEESFALYKRYQVAIHKDPPGQVTREQYTGFLVESPLTAESFPPSLTELADDKAAEVDTSGVEIPAPQLQILRNITHKSDAEITQAVVKAKGDLNAAVQILVSGAKSPHEYLRACARASQSAWLKGEGSYLDEPMQRSTTADAGTGGGGEARSEAATAAALLADFAHPRVLDVPGMDNDASGSDLRLGYGSFHQRYRLDGRLVAVGVVDVLPACLSSVYLFYDPDMPELELGKLTALCEIEWVRSASVRSPRLKYYYMGFYLPECQKMKYKGEYQPSDLLCSDTFTWHTLRHCLECIKASTLPNKYASFGDPVKVQEVQEQRTAEQLRVAVAGETASVAGTVLGEIPFILNDSDTVLTAKDLTAGGKSIVLQRFAEWVPRVGKPLVARLAIELR